ncbi:PAS domain-containing sensor histidine kinase [Massilia psychrophila]|uniref:Oxygen sensor histidine kinase NreB n=1 Tax=Massilia psychrophila TaxID=1603353 RepID=A0A2G8T5A6_9BURK|nr:ATP-binding protein [Massilia psychrophila]PIL41245.1 histidine kinase [Massilia psychrophila]
MNRMTRSLLLLPGPLGLALGLAGGYALARWPARARALHEHADVIIQHASEAIISANDDNIIVMANPSAAAMFGTNVDDMQGSALRRFLTPEPITGDGAAAFFGDTGRVGRRATDYAVSGIRADGEAFPLEGSVSTMQDNGAPIHTIILRDVSGRHRVQEKLTRSHAQLRQLSAALQTIREEERTHIARELHDDLGQLLAALRMDLALLQQNKAGQDSTRLIQGMEQNLLTAIQSLRRIATNLRPRSLDEGGLYFALQGLRDDFVQRYSIACLLYADEGELVLDDSASTAIFRIVQEALTNIARHAGASTVTITLYRSNGEVLLTVRDNGRGIAAGDLEKAQSLGLVGMRERVWAMGGAITINSDEPPGTRIDIVLPLPRRAGAPGAA